MNAFVEEYGFFLFSINLWCGSTAIPLGLTKSVFIITALTFGSSKEATSMVSFSESVQYRRLDTQSTAMPSGDRISVNPLENKLTSIPST